MPEAPPEAPVVPATPDVQEPKPTTVRQVKSLADIKAANKRAPPVPSPIVVEWFLPPTAEEPLGIPMSLEIKTRYPADAWRFQISYMTDVQALKRSQEPDDTGAMVRKHPDADFVAIAKQVVVEPTWLHNEAVVAEFKENVPSPVFAELMAELMLIAGLNGDFFARYPLLTTPRALLIGASESPSGSGSTQTPSGTPLPSNSSPGLSTTGSEEKKDGDSGSKTTSGSSP